MDASPLPKMSVTKMTGLLDILGGRGGREDIYKLAKELNYELGELMEVIKAGEILGFLDTPGGDVLLQDLGKKFLKSKVNTRKIIFKEQLTKIPLFQHLILLLTQADEKKLDKDLILEELARILPHEHPEQTFKTLVNWGRYGELFGYSRDTEQLHLDLSE